MKLWIVVFAAGLLGAAAQGSSAGEGQPLATTLNNFYLRGTQPNGLQPNNEILVATDDCTMCHSDPAKIYNEWSGSLMAHSARDPLFYACLDIANADSPGSGDLCIRCHVPKAWLEGRSTPVNGSNITQADRDGITCNFCHRMVDPFDVFNDAPGVDQEILSALAGDAPVQSVDRGMPPSIGYGGGGSYVIDPFDRRRGPFPIPAGGQPVYPEVACDNYHFGFTYGKCRDSMGDPTGCATFESPHHRRSEICATCHDVSLPHFSYNTQGTALVFNGTNNQHPDGNKYNMAPEQRTFSEWLKSDFALVGGVNMGNRYGCDIGNVSDCQDCHSPGHNVQGCAFEAPRPDVPRHTFRGAATWVLDAIDRHYGPNGPFGGYPPPSGGQDFYADVSSNIQSQIQENVSKMLNCAADLEVTLDDAQSPGVDKLRVRVINQTGHKLPTGYPEGRRMWITVQYFDCTDYDDPMQTLGGYDGSTAHLDEGTTKVYEMKLGLDAALAAMLNRPEGVSSHAILGNKIYKDNRIPPRGFSNLKFAAIQAEPVAYSYADGQYWDDTYFEIPAYAVAARVFLYYQSTSKEYIEFLRDENPGAGVNPQNRGQFAYDLWVATGKSAPVRMASYPPPALPDCQVTPDPMYPCGNPNSINSFMNVSVKGDLSGDRQVDETDIPDFVQVLLGNETDPRKICAADMNNVGGANGADIGLFVEKLLGP